MNSDSVNIIAEFCQNHLGKPALLEQMIIEAKKSGATHAKIQGLYSNEITRRDEFEDKHAPIYRPYEKEVARLKGLDLSFETEKWFVQFCHNQSIIPMITVFTHKGVERAKFAGFKSIKIASYDCASKPIIKKVLEFADEIVISTGATYWQEITETVHLLNRNKKKSQEVAFLHARTIYPTKLSDFGILRMSALAAFGYKIGLSDHTRPEDSKLIASKIAILLGANYIERHFTILEKQDSKDGPISVNPAELKQIKDFSKKPRSVQLAEITKQDLLTTLVCSNLEPTEEEIINRAYYRGRVASEYKGKLVYSWEELEFEE
jgi:sialic acid synthase SpsE